MTSKVEVEANICSHRTVIEVTDKGNGNMAVRIDTDCSSVRAYAEMLPELLTNDYADWEGSRILDFAAKAGLTTTCLVPVALINACWVESGMMSKRLALKEGPLCIRFLE